MLKDTTIAQAALASPKVEFANMMRGIAALCVVVAHYMRVFWLQRSAVADITGSHPLPADIATPSLVFYLNALPYFNWGPFGVALFFLISGFVIPFSAKHHSRASFAIGRLMRILPTYCVGFSVTLLFLAFSWSISGRTFPYSAAQVLFHYVPGLHDLTNSPAIDGIIWTLDVEMKFYVLALIGLGWLRAKSLKAFMLPLLIAPAFLLLAEALSYLAQSNMLLFYIAKGLCLSAPYLAYMFIGTVFHYLHEKAIRPYMAAILICALYFVFIALWIYGPYPLPLMVTYNYLFALVVFAIAFALRNRITQPPLLGALAAISYPLYVIHGVAGYILLSLMLGNGIIWPFAIIFTLVAVLGLSYLLHRYIERPTQDMGRRLAKLY